jgi:hypothetical protein
LLSETFFLLKTSPFDCHPVLLPYFSHILLVTGSLSASDTLDDGGEHLREISKETSSKVRKKGGET